MNDIRRTILWVIFGFSLVLLWDRWQVHNGRTPTFFPPPPAALESGATGGDAPVPAANATLPAKSGAGDVPATEAGAPSESAPEPVVVKTDVFELTFDPRGGSLIKAVLLQQADLEHKDQPIVLLDESKNRVYLAQTGLVGVTGLPSHKSVMAVDAEVRVLQEGTDEITVRFESPVMAQAQLVKTYTLRRGRYDIAVRHEVVNLGNAPLNTQLYMQLVRDGNKLPGESSLYSTFTGPAVYTEAKKYQKVEFSDIESNSAQIEKHASNGYVAMVQHYFASAWLLGDGIERELFTRKVSTNLYSVGMLTALPAVEPGGTYALDARLYVGPQDEKQLAELYPGLELVKDYGWVTILAKPLYWLIKILYDVIGNWGWAIVALVVLLKAAFFWLNAKAYASMAKMKAINPRLMEMRERLKDKPQQMQQEMMRIYREEKVNPMGGCFPIVIQIPVFIALYWVLLSSVEIRNAPWMLWIQDLSSPDPYFILPLVMTATSLLQTWLNPTPPDPMQAKMMWIMPLVFSVMFFFFPAGLVLYWITNNVLSIAQQWVINRKLGVS